MTPLQTIARLAVALALVALAATLGGSFTASSVQTWYTTLNKPAFTPPGWLFGPVWTLLYAAMAVAAFLVWQRHGLVAARIPLALFATQLVLNVLWSVFFFGMRNPTLALVDILLLEAAILATILAFWPRNRLAAILLIPYALWVAFATLLNLRIVQLNP